MESFVRGKILFWPFLLDTLPVVHRHRQLVVLRPLLYGDSHLAMMGGRIGLQLLASVVVEIVAAADKGIGQRLDVEMTVAWMWEAIAWVGQIRRRPNHPNLFTIKNHW